jgi:hypothetical protein
MCNLCRRTAIDDNASGQRRLSGVRRTLAKLGLDIGNVEIPLRLTNQTEISQLSTHDYCKRPSGPTRNNTATINGEIVDRQVKEILLLHGLPREQAAGMIAHELGHAWLFSSAFPQLSPMVEEGICNLCQYIWLQQRTGADWAVVGGRGRGLDRK